MIRTWWERAKKGGASAVRFVSYWREVPWTILLLVGLVIGFYLIPRIDPAAGIDGFGDMWKIGIAVFAGQVIAFSAWWCKNHYMVDMTDEEEKLIMDRASRSNKAWTPLLVIIVDRLTFFGWLFLWYLVVSG